MTTNARFSRCRTILCFVSWQRGLGILAAGLYLAYGGGLSSCRAQSIQFDASPSVACDEVVDPEFSANTPDEKLILVKCQVSILGIGDAGRHLSECLFHFYSPETHTRVHDFSPKTLLSTDIVGNIQIAREGEQSQGMRVGASGEAQSIVTAELSASKDDRNSEKRTYAMLPPREVISAAGTLGHGSGAYFKLRRSSQQTLEGTQSFLLTLRVPLAWRGGYLRLNCQAFNPIEHNSAPPIVSQAAFLIPLFKTGDLEAKRAALKLMSAEQGLIGLAQQSQEALRRASRPTVWYEIALKDPKVPDQWLISILRQSSEAPFLGFEQYLPNDIQRSIQRLREEKRNLREWSIGASTDEVARNVSVK